MKKYIYLLICISLLLSGCSKSSEPVKGNPDPLIGVITANGERLTSKEDYERAILNVNATVQDDTEWGNIENSNSGLQQAAYDFGAKVAEVEAVKTIVEETLDNYTDETYSTEFHDSYGVVNIPDINEEQASKYTQTFNIAASELGIEDYKITVNLVNTATEPNNNFNTYNIPENQETTDKYVLNKNPERMRIHYPSCNDVKKISPEHYETTNLSISELKAQGYVPCGHCKPHD